MVDVQVESGYTSAVELERMPINASRESSSTARWTVEDEKANKKTAVARAMPSLGMHDLQRWKGCRLATNSDLDARVFVVAGDLEVPPAQYAAIRLVSNIVKFAENLALRNYPSLKLEVQLHRDKDHATVWPLSLSEGMIWTLSE